MKRSRLSSIIREELIRARLGHLMENPCNRSRGLVESKGKEGKGMTVQEFIEILKGYPADLRVRFEAFDADEPIYKPIIQVSPNFTEVGTPDELVIEIRYGW